MTTAAETIVAREIQQHIETLAADSMRGRDTPSAELERTARYVASQFEAAGLAPGGEGNTWFQRYSIPGQLDVDRSRIIFAAGGQKAVASFNTAVKLAYQGVRDGSPPTDVVVVSGNQDSESIEQAKLRQKFVVYMPLAGTDRYVLLKNIQVLASRSSGNCVVVVNASDSATFATVAKTARRNPVIRFGGRCGTMHVLPQAVRGLSEVFAAAGVPLERARTDSTPVIREVPAMQLTLELVFERRPETGASAPNVIGILEGSDPKLKNDYLVISAPMDRAVRAGQADSIVNGDVSGTAGLISLAKTLTQPGVRPRRSVVFVATSGSVKWWGSDAAAGALKSSFLSSSFFKQPRDWVANIMLDMIGRAPGDSIIVRGIPDAKLATSPQWIAMAHPELGLRIVDGGTAAVPVSDHFEFVRRGVPSLYFHNGRHDDSTSAAPALNPDQEAQIVRLVLYVIHNIGNADVRPQWTAAGRRAFLSAIERDRYP